MQTGISQDYKLGISGGTAKNKYLISANVLNMTAMTITTKYQRAQLRINLDNELTKWLTLSTKINASRTHSHNGGMTYELPELFSYDGNERSGNGRL